MAEQAKMEIAHHAVVTLITALKGTMASLWAEDRGVVKVAMEGELRSNTRRRHTANGIVEAPKKMVLKSRKEYRIPPNGGPAILPRPAIVSMIPMSRTRSVDTYQA